MAKRIIFTLILIMFLTAVYMNGNAKDVPLADIESDLLREKTFRSMEQAGDRRLLQFFRLNPENFREYIYFRNTEALSVEELLIIKAGTRDDIPAVRDAVYGRIKEQTKLFESYGPKQVATLKNAVVLTKGNYLFYCTGEKAERYREVFLDAVQ